MAMLTFPKLINLAATLFVLIPLCSGTGSTTMYPCPVNSLGFDSQSGIDGAILDGPGNPNLLYSWGAGSWPSSIFQCYQACNRWPTPNGVRLRAKNGESGACAYWTWMGGQGCRLYGCGVCRNYQAYSPKENFPTPSSPSKRYCSGGGPARTKCPGGVKGDPHYYGGDKSHFDFTGVPNKHYCLISDKNLHINVYYGGRYGVWGNNTHKPMTWIRKVGIMWRGHTVEMEARAGAAWEYEQGYMSRIKVDGNDVTIAKVGDAAAFDNGNIQIMWAAARLRSGDDEIDVYRVMIRKYLRMTVKVRPEVPILRTNDDGVVHFTLEFPVVELSEDAHGILGQTYRPDHKDRLARQVQVFDKLLNVNVIKGENGEGYLDGKPDDYVSSGLLTPDCAVSRFTPKEDEFEVITLDDKITSYRKLLR